MKEQEEPAVAEADNPHAEHSGEELRHRRGEPDALWDGQVEADGEDEEQRGFYKHVHAVPGEGGQAPDKETAEKGQNQLACQHSPQVSQDAEGGNGENHEGKADDHGGHIQEKVAEVLPRPFKMLPMVEARYMKGQSQDRAAMKNPASGS